MSERMLEFDPSIMDEEQDFSAENEGPQMCGICWNTNRIGEYVQKQAYPTVLTDDNGHAQVTDPEILKTLSPEEIISWECAECYASTQNISTYTGKTTTHPLIGLGGEAGLQPTVWKQMANNHSKKRVSKDPEEQAWNELVEISFT